MSSTEFHEEPARLSERTKNHHRAIVSLMEEREAVDWYDQRIDVTDDESLKQILIHNRDEEKEHAAMMIEWLRRNDEVFAEELKTYLFTDAPITEVEEAAMGSNSGRTPAGRRGLPRRLL